MISPRAADVLFFFFSFGARGYFAGKGAGTWDDTGGAWERYLGQGKGLN